MEKGEQRPAPLPAGSFIRLRSDPNLSGSVVSSTWDVQVEDWHYRIRFGMGTRGVPASNVELVPEESDLIDELARGRSSNAASFLTLMTYERLRKPPSRVAASFGSAKAVFYPFQFTPLLKFLESPNQRILIADDVGLGKTIEAGYILRELRARHGLQRILIVVPAQLRSKWKSELERRFAESFEIVSGREIAALGADLKRGREPEPFRWIVSYEAVRTRPNIEIFDEYKPPIDLAIFDEAHRLRNPETLQARFARALAESVDALLLLTATPTNTKIDDLFWLLHLLDPERYSSPQLFAEQMQANKPIVRALARLRGGSSHLQVARKELSALSLDPLTVELTREPFFTEILRRLDEGPKISRRELVSLQREVSALSLTGPVVSRTRKVDVFPDRQPRRAQVVRIPLTDVEEHVYQGVAHLFQVFRSDLDNRGLRLALTTILRMAGSCLPAAAGRFESFVSEHLATAELSAEYDFGDETAEQLQSAGSVNGEEILRRLAILLRDYRAGSHPDSKFEHFLRAVRGVWKDDDRSAKVPRKIVVFSTFIGTLDYLSKKLENAGIRHFRIDGKVPVREREVFLERFQNEDVRILLSSEVGSEGIDLQFASVMVNYDLPWNPMVVEQRIGRLDRIGQMKPIVVVNLILADTIEERILHRLFDRIGVFRDTIGELEPILGDETVEDLVVEALSSALSPKEETERADNTAQALVQQEQAAERVRSEADGLLAADQAFLDEIEGLTRGRRIPNGRELLAFLNGVLDAHFPGCEVPPRLISDVGKCSMTAPVLMELRKLQPDPEVSRVAGLLEAGELRCTFSPEAALRHPRADLLHARHPVLRFALEWMQRRRGEAFRGFHLRLATGAVPPGLYVFGVSFLEVFGGRPRTEIRTVFLPLGDSEPLADEIVETLFPELLDRAEDPFEPLEFDPVRVEEGLRRVRSLAEVERQRLQHGESALNAARAARRRSTLENTHGARIRAAEVRLTHLGARGAAEFPVQMARAKLAKVRDEYKHALQVLDVEANLRVEDEEVALGLLSVRGRE